MAGVHYGIGKHLIRAVKTDPSPPDKLVNLFKVNRRHVHENGRILTHAAGNLGRRFPLGVGDTTCQDCNPTILPTCIHRQPTLVPMGVLAYLDIRGTLGRGHFHHCDRTVSPGAFLLEPSLCILRLEAAGHRQVPRNPSEPGTTCTLELRWRCGVITPSFPGTLETANEPQAQT